VEIAMEEATTDKETERKRSRMPDEEVESYIMSMAVNVETLPAAVAAANAAEEEEELEEEKDVPLAEPLRVADEELEKLLRRLNERREARMIEREARMERIYQDLEETQARVHTESSAPGDTWSLISTTTRESPCLRSSTGSCGTNTISPA
jgi:hypothetical protein